MQRLHSWLSKVREGDLEHETHKAIFVPSKPRWEDGFASGTLTHTHLASVQEQFLKVAEHTPASGFGPHAAFAGICSFASVIGSGISVVAICRG